MKPLVLSLGGSIIVPDKPDHFFLREFKQFVLDYLNQFRFVIVCGGGKTSANYVSAAQRVSNVPAEQLDRIGIRSSILNAELVKSIFGSLACKRIITNPTAKIRCKKPIVIGSGWKPGWSTDYDAVLLAKQIGSKTVINLSNIAQVYSRDPRKYKSAKPFKKLSWKKYRSMISKKWSPRLSSPFDPIASKEAQKCKMTVAILKGTDIPNLRIYLDGKDFIGTIIR